MTRGIRNAKQDLHLSQTLHVNQPKQLQNLVVAWVAWLYITGQVLVELEKPKSKYKSVVAWVAWLSMVNSWASKLIYNFDFVW